MDRLVIALPTRGRPDLLLQTLPKTLENIRNPNTQIVVMLDADDGASLKALEAKFGGREADHLILNVHEREDTIGTKYNRVLSWNGDVFMGLPDHSFYVTPGFDEKILEAASKFPDGIGVVFSHYANLSFTYLNALTRKYIDLQGFYYPPWFPYWWVDHFAEDVARIVGRVGYADVQCDSSNKQPTQEVREPAFWATWYDAGFAYRRKIAHRIIDALDMPDWWKEMQKNHHHAWIVDQRARYIHDGVRQMPFNLSLDDERYQRAKTKALEMLPALFDAAADVQEDIEKQYVVAYRNYLMPSPVPSLKQHYAA
jgi:hypothetical protein